MSFRILIYPPRTIASDVSRAPAQGAVLLQKSTHTQRCSALVLVKVTRGGLEREAEPVAPTNRNKMAVTGEGKWEASERFEGYCTCEM